MRLLRAKSWHFNKCQFFQALASIDDFIFPHEKLDQNNEWISLAGLIPWEAIMGSPHEQTIVKIKPRDYCK